MSRLAEVCVLRVRSYFPNCHPWSSNESKVFTCVCVLVCFRPVCPSGDGGVLELCSSLSPLDPLPYSTWPFIYSASLAGEQKDTWEFTLIWAWRFPLWLFSHSVLFPKGLWCHSALWKDQFRETAGAVRAVLPAPHTNWYTKGKHLKPQLLVMYRDALPGLLKLAVWFFFFLFGLDLIAHVCLFISFCPVRRWMRWSWR